MPAPTADRSTADRSYRALLAVPSIGRVLLGMQIARIAQSMVGVAVVLFTLTTYRSPALAGVVTFAATFPAVFASPVAGALLDRHGRTRLVVLDYLLEACALLLVAGLSLVGALPPWLLIAIAAVSSLTGPLSSTGLRSLFPLIVPHHLWERANAADSTGYVLATVVGPPFAGFLFQVAGPQVALGAIGAVFVVAALVLLRIPDPKTDVASTGRLWLDAWQGLLYVWRNPTLRALGFSISLLNLAGGVTTIVIPLIVLERLQLGPAAVGIVFAVQGIGGVVAAFFSGRIDTRGRERRMLVVPMAATAGAMLLLLPSAGLPLVVLGMAIMGVLNGPMDIALFTIRQRRTNPAWMGRAFAVSMAFNSSGFPIGSALTGWVAASSLELAILVGVGACLVAAVVAQRMIPEA